MGALDDRRHLNPNACRYGYGGLGLLFPTVDRFSCDSLAFSSSPRIMAAAYAMQQGKQKQQQIFASWRCRDAAMRNVPQFSLSDLEASGTPALNPGLPQHLSDIRFT
jgi:hypothetical protein